MDRRPYGEPMIDTQPTSAQFRFKGAYTALFLHAAFIGGGVGVLILHFAWMRLRRNFGVFTTREISFA